MNCPVCKTAELKMAERQGVEIDYCPQCRGIWLDRGELDKIIERASDEFSGGSGPAAPPPQQPRYAPPPAHPASMYDSDYGKHHYKKKRKHWLLEILD